MMNRALVNLGNVIEQSIPNLWKLTSRNAAQAIGCADQIGNIMDACKLEALLATISQGKVIHNSNKAKS